MGASSSSQAGAAPTSSQHRLETKDLPSLRLLGKGLSGFVYETIWKGTKYARKDFPIGPGGRKIFEKEVSDLLKLKHRNIVECIDYTVGKSSCSLLLEYVDADLQNDMERRIEAQIKKTSTGSRRTSQDKRLWSEPMLENLFEEEITGFDEVSSRIMPGDGLPQLPFALDEAVDLISQLATGMKYLHDNRIVHGDLKPKNILVRMDQSGKMVVKVADFGLVETKKRIKLVSKRTRHFDILTWKAPELLSKLLGPLTVDSDDPFTDSDTDLDEEMASPVSDFFKSGLTMADVYSFGLTCVYILCGQLFFPELSLTQLRTRRLENCWPRLPSSCPNDLKSLIYSCLESNPTNRPPFSDICRHNALKPPLPSLSRDSMKVEEAEDLTPSSLAATFAPGSIEIEESSGCGAMGGSMESKFSKVEWQIERSKMHWTELAERASPRAFRRAFRPNKGGEAAAEADNVKVFRKLQLHPTCGSFFKTFGYDEPSGRENAGSLEVGKKFAEGGQAELVHARVTWRYPGDNEDLARGTEFALKVFKKGTFLRELQFQWPQGFLQSCASNLDRLRFGLPTLGETRPSVVICGTILKDGRFAYLMDKLEEDLRSLIDRKMRRNSGKHRGPFQEDQGDAEQVMYHIALGMKRLHRLGIIHRDLKASNVLVRKSLVKGWDSYVADFECSIGVVGTGFWRAPEILQALKERNVSKRWDENVFSKEADVYSYGMTCYEILTGKIPFEDHPRTDFDLVLNGKRPELPDYVDDWIRELVTRCWQTNPKDRPSFKKILRILKAGSKRVRQTKLWEAYIGKP